MSVNWSALSSVEHTKGERVGFGVISLTKEVSRAAKQDIEYSPIKDDPVVPDNPAHCDVVGEKKSRPLRRLLAGKVKVCEAPSKEGLAG